MKFIGRKKLGLTTKEVGRLTLTAFNRQYHHYKMDFDLELSMLLTRKTYSMLREQAAKDEEWLP